MCAAWTRKFSVFLLLWLALTLVGLMTAKIWDPLLYYFLGYAGFVLAVEFSEPEGRRPEGHTRLRWLTIAGFAGFVYLVVDWGLSVIATVTA